MGLAACTNAIQSSAVVPDAKPLRLGGFTLYALRDGGFKIPNNGSVFGLNASQAEVSKVLQKARVGTSTIPLDVDALLVKMPGHLVLIDTGLGPAGHGVLLESLGKIGISPASITDVFITHAHGDHVGGLVTDSHESAFPKATIRLSSKEWNFMQSQKDTAEIATAVRSQVKTFEPGKPVLPGITPILQYGHTPGHVGYEIVSQGHRLRDIGDIAHSSIVSLARPDWTILWDTDRLAGVRQRRTQLASLASKRELIFAPHFPFPGIGRVSAKGSGFVFLPLKP